MKNLLFVSCILTFAILLSCGGDKQDSTSEQSIPDNREFSPFDIGETPVNGKNLSQQIQSFYNNIFDKEVSVVIAPDFGYIQKGINIRFSDKGVRGEYGPFGIKRSYKDTSFYNLEAFYKDKFLVFKGKLRFNILKGKDVNLIDAHFVETYKGEEIAQNRSLSWNDLTIDNPVLPGEIMQLVSPLKGIEVTVTDKVFTDDNDFTDYVRIYFDSTKTGGYISCLFPLDDTGLKSIIKDNVYTIKGKIDNVKLESGRVWITECQLVK